MEKYITPNDKEEEMQACQQHALRPRIGVAWLVDGDVPAVKKTADGDHYHVNGRS